MTIDYKAAYEKIREQQLKLIEAAEDYIEDAVEYGVPDGNARDWLEQAIEDSRKENE